MGKHACFLLAAIALLFSSCTGNQCDHFEFSDSFESVQGSILALDSLMHAGNTNCNARYSAVFGVDSLRIMDRNKSDSFNLRAFCIAAKRQDNDLRKVSSFMRRNSISSASLRNGIYFYNFNYCNANNDFRYTRYIVVNADSVRSKLVGYTVLDTQADLLLVAPVGYNAD
jgi:hypothetical protein